MNSNKIEQHQIDKIEEDPTVKYDSLEERYPKPMKLMQAYTDGHLGTYAPSNFFLMKSLMFRFSEFLHGGI